MWKLIVFSLLALVSVAHADEVQCWNFSSSNWYIAARINDHSYNITADQRAGYGMTIANLVTHSTVFQKTGSIHLQRLDRKTLKFKRFWVRKNVNTFTYTDVDNFKHTVAQFEESDECKSMCDSFANKDNDDIAKYPKLAKQCHLGWF